jgi:hypothetical protein
MRPRQAMLKTAKRLIVAIAIAFTLAVAFNQPVLADCEPNYGGGETCVYNKRFEIEKEVRFEGDNEWKDKITNVKEGDVVEFRIRITNLSDEDSEDYVDFDNMEMKDILPDELYRIAGDQLEVEWNDFEPGETKEFIIKVKVEANEYDRNESFEKCVVNKAEVYWDGTFEGSDTATVCYGKGVPTELPETGFESTLALIGAGFVATGFVLSKSRKFAK